MSTIVDIHGRQILDSRGNPTVEVDVTLADGTVGTAAVPSGASTGVHEAWELRDGDKSVYLGKGVSQAVENVNDKLADELIGMDALDQIAVDGRMIELDGTPNKKNLRRQRDPRRLAGHGPCGGQVLRPAALPLPRRLERPAAAGPDDEHPQRRPARRQQRRRPGVHGHAAGLRLVQRRPPLRLRNLPQPQEGAARQEAQHGGRRRRRLRPRPEDQRRGARRDPDRHREGRLQARRAGLHRHGSWPAPSSTTPRRRSTRSTARSSTAAGDGRPAGRAGSRSIPICSIEDGCAEDDWDGWKLLTERLGDKCQLVGDDLFVTNVERLQRGIDEGIANSILIKVNQIGTLTETIDAINLAHRNGYTSITSHRSGETEDATIADLAVACAPARSRPARPRAATAWPSTTSCCGSKSNSATPPSTAAGFLRRNTR